MAETSKVKIQIQPTDNLVRDIIKFTRTLFYHIDDNVEITLDYVEVIYSVFMNPIGEKINKIRLRCDTELGRRNEPTKRVVFIDRFITENGQEKTISVACSYLYTDKQTTVSSCARKIIKDLFVKRIIFGALNYGIYLPLSYLDNNDLLFKKKNRYANEYKNSAIVFMMVYHTINRADSIFLHQLQKAFNVLSNEFNLYSIIVNRTKKEYKFKDVMEIIINKEKLPFNPYYIRFV